jgi:hypothetical protein
MTTAALALLTTGAQAFWTECTVNKEIDAVDRPHGENGSPRWETLAKGTKIALRDTYQDWAFVSHRRDEGNEEYGWVPRGILSNCKPQEGTP